MRLLLDLLLIVVLSSVIILDKALNLLTLKELKRRARGGQDKKAAKVYRMAAYGRPLLIYLWLGGSVAAALLLIMVVPHTWFWVLVYLGLLAWAVRGWRPAHGTKSWVWAWAATVAPLTAWKMNYLGPVLAKVIRKKDSLQPSKVYEKEDMLEFLRSQVNQPDNRISETELKIAYNALVFGDKKVADVMTPLRKVRLVSEDEAVGPMLMDELHKTGFSRFPVAKTASGSANPDIVGTLFLKDIILHEGGQVRDVMHKPTYFINEIQSLQEALDAFLKTHGHLFVVVNNFEEVVGVLSIEDVLEQILGQKIIDEFDKYDDLRAVASYEAKKDYQMHQHVTPNEQPAPSQEA